MAHKIAAERIKKEKALEVKYKKPIGQLRKEAQRKRKQQKLEAKQQRLEARKNHHSFLSRILDEKDADLLDHFHSPYTTTVKLGDVGMAASDAYSSVRSADSSIRTPLDGSPSRDHQRTMTGTSSVSSMSSSMKKTKTCSCGSDSFAKTPRRRGRSGSIGRFTKAFGRLLSGEDSSTKSPVIIPDDLVVSNAESPTCGLVKQRKLMESARFVEAVGEIPLQVNTQGGINIIEDSDDDNASVSSTDETVLTTMRQQCEDSTVVDDDDEADDDDDLGPPHVVDRKRKTRRPQWPFGIAQQPGNELALLDKLPNGHVEAMDLEYSGIHEQSLEITKRGIARGNYAQLHRKAWLEVSDHYHRYGKNLRLYYRHWETLGCPTNKFFDWLDSKGEAAGEPLPNLEECPRKVLDCDMVRYITNPKVTEGYALYIVPNEEGIGQIIDVDGDPVQTGPEGWIFVVRDNKMYGGPKVRSITGKSSKLRFHHSSFFGGKAVAAAGIIITDSDGYLKYLYLHSGHYRPGEAEMQRCLFFLHRKGVDLQSFEIDVQQINHVARDEKGDKNKGEKKAKVDTLQLVEAVFVACYLAHKASCIGNGIFSRIQQIRTSDATTVTEALDAVDDGGVRKLGTRIML